ncbi:MAG: hypothetical protein HYV28_04495 [Ignavibacteriales bacterium]|nr:hypothetical protein [Ignavibacteriales bacterium]
MHKSFTVFIVAFLIGFSAVVRGQVIYEDISSPVYQYLKAASNKGQLNLNTFSLPLSRKQITALLISMPDTANRRKTDWEFNRFQDEYFSELNSPVHKHRYLFYHHDTLFTAKITPFAGYTINSVKNNIQREQFIGAKFSIELSDWFGGNFTYIDRGEFGTHIDKKKEFSSRPGSFIKDAPGGFEYSEVTGAINANWKWGSVSLLKEKFTWGSGHFGQLIFSEKAPSFPRVNLTLKPTDWISFTYFHGWLSSMVFDSNNFYYNHNESYKPFLRKNYIPKYIVANALSVTPLDWFSFSIGNSFVYSGNIRAEMFIPFMYYKVMDHNTGRADVDDGNGQLFSDYRFKLPYNVSLYGTLFLDVIELREVLSGNLKTSWAAYTFGADKYDFLLDGLNFNLEYSRVNPWVYEHKDETTEYKNLNYSLGHWLGQNADMIGIAVNYNGMSKTRMSMSLEYIRKGGLFDIAIPYEDTENDINFLSGAIRKEIRIQTSIAYEYPYDLFTSLQYEYSYITDQDATRGPQWLLGANNTLRLSVRYGLQF